MRDPKVIIAVDPGGTTGYAYWVAPVNGRGEVWGTGEVADCDQDTQLMELMADLGGICRHAEPYTAGIDIHLLCERFEFRMEERYRTRIDYNAPEVVGALRLWAWERPNLLVIKTGASLGKGFWSDAKMKTLGVWVRGKGHAMDAMRHLLRYRVFTLNHKYLLNTFKPDPA